MSGEPPLLVKMMIRMKRTVTILSLLLFLLGAGPVHAQMTDAQIIEYITTSAAAGKSERQIGNELLSRGVTAAQLQQLMRTYNVSASQLPVSSSGTQGLQTALPVRRTTPVPGEINGEPRPAVAERPETQSGDNVGMLYDASGRKRIYGRDIFTSSSLSFEPNQNLATPADYVLGPGDELIIDIWGANEVTIRQTITPEGTISLTQLGPVALSGLTIQEAKGKLESVLSKTYSSLRSRTSHLTLTLGEVRTILVNVMGEVESPGTYRLSSFATVFHALYLAGGITEIGSLRQVRVMRRGEELTVADVYKYIFEGRLDTDVALKEGDVIIVPPYETLASISGFVRRPMFYELKPGETVQSLIRYAGGFSDGAWSEDLYVERNDGRSNHSYTVSSDQFGSFALSDGDAVHVSGTLVDLFDNRVTLRGAVYRPGSFQLGGDIVSVKQLVEHGGGLLPDAFLGRAQLIREKEDRSLEVRSIPIKGIMEGLAEDILLRRNDVLVISNVNEVEPKGDLEITGEVLHPGRYPFAEHTTLEDLILFAGGLTEGASAAKVDVARRIAAPYSSSASDTLAQVFSLSIKDGLLEDGAAGFELSPNDIVSVRKSPSYVEQRNVTITGEVTFPGQYTLSSTNERVSQLLQRAGGPTPNAYVRGAMLKRRISPYEQNVRMQLNMLANQTVSSKDSLDLDKLMVSDIYTVGLELDRALAQPGSDYDIVLREGDELIVPETTSSVRIQGEVLYPNTVHFISGKPVSYYVKQAGGYTSRARRSKVYVIYMNGTVSVGTSSKLEPGCELVVPARAERNRLTTSEWLGIGTSSASIATMVATIVNLFLKY